MSDLDTVLFGGSVGVCILALVICAILIVRCVL
jgi:hypothetical protein